MPKVIVVSLSVNFNILALFALLGCYDMKSGMGKISVIPHCTDFKDVAYQLRNF